MALVKKLEEISMDNPSVHGEATCTYTVFHDKNGNPYLQVDTYGSQKRQIIGKKSQSTQFGPEALSQLRSILDAL